MRNALVLLGLAVTFSGPVYAQSEADDARADLKPRIENGVRYLCGGIGAGESEAMKKAATDYDLTLMFAVSTGAYLADVDVRIVDANGQSVLATKCDGPMLLVDVPKSGTYRIEAETGGHKLSRSSRVDQAGKRTSISMIWPEHATRMGAEPGGGQQSSGDGSKPAGQ